MNSVYKLAFAGLAMAALLISVQPAAAHHSGAGFESDKVVELSGTIKEFQFKNPHTWIQVLVQDAKARPPSGVSNGAVPIPSGVKATVHQPFRRAPK